MNSLLNRVLSSAKARGQKAVSSTAETFKDTPIHSKIGLGMGAASFGMGVGNYANNKKNAERAALAAENESKRLALEQKSLSALNAIHRSLNKPKLNNE